MANRLAASFILISLALFLQLGVGNITGLWFGFSLAALVAFSFYLPILELIFFVLFSVLILNWKPSLSAEMMFFTAMPLLSFWLRKLLPFRPWLTNIFFIFLAVVVTYLAFGFGIIIGRPVVFLLDILASILYGFFAFKVLSAQ